MEKYIIVTEPSGIVEMGCADLMPGSCQLSWMNEFEDTQISRTLNGGGNSLLAVVQLAETSAAQPTRRLQLQPSFIWPALQSPQQADCVGIQAAAIKRAQ